MTREIKVVQRVLAVNERMAEENRRRFAAKGIFVLNVMSSPGSGKTTTLHKTIERLMPGTRTAVIVGDIATTHDADRLAVTGAPVVQVNTDAFGGDCHLEPHVIEKAADDLDLDAIDLLIVENVGNLVCPSSYDLGEDAKIVLLSTTEGEDKPLKYPSIFFKSELMLLTKIDLLPYVPFKAELARENARRIHPGMEIIDVSSITGEGLDRWMEWLRTREAKAKPAAAGA